MIGLDIELTLEPIYVPYEIRTSLTAIFLAFLIFSGPLFLCLFICLNKKKKVPVAKKNEENFPDILRDDEEILKDKKYKEKYSLPYSEIDLASHIAVSITPFKWGPQCIHYKRKAVSIKHSRNLCSTFGNVLNYYTTKTKFWAALALAAFCFEVFDTYSDVVYVIKTEFNQEWMYYTSIFVVIFPIGANLVMALEVF